MDDVSTIAKGPLWLLAELTYACPLQCPYCSNPVDFALHGPELRTADWVRVMGEARVLGAAQLGLSGGEPLTRTDLEELVAEGRRLGYYTNLITSGLGMNEARVKALRDAGLDHVQVSFQASEGTLNDLLAGTRAFEHKLAMARSVKDAGFPMVLCFVIHRSNIDRVADMLALAARLGANYVELATTQYYGWALLNREQLMPTRAQLDAAEAAVNAYRERNGESMRIYYVVPDYYETRPKPCMNGWGNVFLTIAPDGTALPCQAARELPGIDFPNVREHSVEWIWRDSPALNHYRGEAWMKEPCRTCTQRSKDFGGCRCQAYLLTGDAANADPVCDKSPHHHVVEAAIASGGRDGRKRPDYIFRNPANSKKINVSLR
ncbi:MAG: pyrroloquinoline quinone biosynthesis protein PqqE [Gammaproteobacteria bacterium]|nr:pyrroloquinoline quinone biosynthesis protein PqqE [Gammaproteobacteria bacterium]